MLINNIISTVLLIGFFNSCSHLHMEKKIRERFDEYVDALNDHDIDKALVMLSESYVLELPGNYLVNKSQVRPFYEFDKGANSVYRFVNISYHRRSISADLIENNDIMTKLKIKPIEARVTYYFDTELKIERQSYTPIADISILNEKINKVADWAASNYPEIIAEIYYNGQIKLSEENSRKWIWLIEKWNVANSEN